MAEEKPRLARLTAIITQLQSKRMVTAREIAERHHVSIRTVYRDIRTLEKSGIPIVTEEGKGYSMMEGYKLPPIMFTEEEAHALITAGQLVQKNKDQSLVEYHERAITKIKAVLGYDQQSQTELISDRIQIRNNYHGEKTSNFLIQLQLAISNFQLVNLEYLSLNEEQTHRKVEPFALYTTQGNWILIAYCRMRADFRAFRLDRIQTLRVTYETFPAHELTLTQFFEQCTDTPDIPMAHGQAIFASNQIHNHMQTVNVAPFNMIGIAIRTSNANGQAAQEIGALWGKFLAENILEQIPNKVNSTVFSLYTDYEGDHTHPYSAILGCEVKDLSEIPEGMVGRSFEGGSYLKTTAKGDLMKGVVVDKWMEIWNMDLDRAYTADFEVFGEKAQNPSDAEVEFYIAVK